MIDAVESFRYRWKDNRISIRYETQDHSGHKYLIFVRYQKNLPIVELEMNVVGFVKIHP